MIHKERQNNAGAMPLMSLEAILATPAASIGMHDPKKRDHAALESLAKHLKQPKRRVLRSINSLRNSVWNRSASVSDRMQQPLGEVIRLARMIYKNRTDQVVGVGKLSLPALRALFRLNP